MEFITFEQKGFIGIITINRPSALNALNAQVIEELDMVLDGISQEEDIRCIIVTGAGNKAFVAGADIASMLALDKQSGVRWGERGNAVFRKLELLPVPVIAAVNGFALGGGCELALACDIRLASENAIFGQPEASLGIPPGFGGTQRLPRLIGEGLAKELMYTTKKINAEEALAIGLVNHVYPAETLMEEAMKLAEKVARNAPIAVRAVKTAVNRGMQTDIDHGIALEAEVFGGCFETQDQHNAMAAFVEKRKAEPFCNR